MKTLINDILLLLLLLTTFATPFAFIEGLYLVFSSKKFENTDLDLANKRTVKGYKWILFSLICLVVGFGACFNVRLIV